MKENFNIVILSGGVGSRLWPLSRKSKPKQYLEIFQNKSLFYWSIARNREIGDRFIVVGNQNNHHLSSTIFNELGVEYTEIIEAVPRNTAPAIAFAALASKPDDTLLIIPSDHIVENQDLYIKHVQEAKKLAADGSIVTFGIQPTKPETGYGYIESKGQQVVSFREKPNKETALGFIKSGNFLWNSGMFCFKAHVYLSELQKYEPVLFDSIVKAWENSENGVLKEADMLNIPSKSIDYAVMERSSKIKVLAGDFGWSDLGSFESLYEYFIKNGLKADRNGNLVIGTDKYTEFLGLKNTILVDTNDAVLVLRKRNAQDVKNIFEKLETENPKLVD